VRASLVSRSFRGGRWIVYGRHFRQSGRGPGRLRTVAEPRAQPRQPVAAAAGRDRPAPARHATGRLLDHADPRPGTPTAAGIENLLLATAVWFATTAISLRIHRTAAPAQRRIGLQNLVLLQVATLPYIAGTVMIVLGMPGALNVVVLGMILSFLKAALDAWVLLIEINR
jgi:hypothetical protein